MKILIHCIAVSALAVLTAVLPAQQDPDRPKGGVYEGVQLDLVEAKPSLGKRQKIEYVSRADDTLQPGFAYLPNPKGSATKDGVPLLVILHTWSGDYRQRSHRGCEQFCENQGWAYIHPQMRGPNRTPEATGSDLVVADIVSAVAWAKRWANVDARRVYVVGTSGGAYTALLVAGKHPELWAGVSAWVPISDLAMWFADCKKSGREKYAANLVSSCGGEPGASDSVDAQFRRRSALTWLAAAKSIPVDINAGIRDGIEGSVPVRHSLLAFNALADSSARLEDEVIESLSDGEVPEDLKISSIDAAYGDKPVLFRRQSSRARVTLFEGGHEIIETAAMNWLAEQVLEIDTNPSAELPRARPLYRGREIAKTMHWRGAPWLMRPEREKEENTERMLSALGIRAGQTVCDLGAGNGYHSLPMAGMVGEEGRVLAVDIQPQMLKLLSKRASKSGISNILCVESTIVDPKLKPSSCDLILLVDVYHEFSHPELMLDAMRRALKPSGRLALVEFRGEDAAVPIKRLHKMTKAQIQREVLPHGFRLAEQFDELPWQHVMIFERSDR